MVIGISLKLFQLLVDWSLCGKLTFLCQRDIYSSICKCSRKSLVNQKTWWTKNLSKYTCWFFHYREVKTTILRTSLSHGSMSVSENEGNLWALEGRRENVGVAFSGVVVSPLSRCRVGSGFQMYLEDRLHEAADWDGCWVPPEVLGVTHWEPWALLLQAEILGEGCPQLCFPGNASDYGSQPPSLSLC